MNIQEFTTFLALFMYSVLLAHLNIRAGQKWLKLLSLYFMLVSLFIISVLLVKILIREF